jgi:hypothetical protein
MIVEDILEDSERLPSLDRIGVAKLHQGDLGLSRSPEQAASTRDEIKMRSALPTTEQSTVR